MNRPKKIPSYRLHASSGQGIVTLPDALGMRKDVLLGKYGTPESLSAYARVLAEWEASGRTVPTRQAPSHGLSVSELILRYWNHLVGYYRDPEGNPTQEITHFKLALKTLREMYGPTLAASFGPMALRAIQGRMVADGLSRKTIKGRIRRIRACIKWGVSHELLPSHNLEGLRAVPGLSRGRTDAKENEPVKPIHPTFVDRTAAHATQHLRDMIYLQYFGAMRPGELVRMKASEIDMTGEVWLYRPTDHKTKYRGHSRVIALGPRAQEIVKRNLKTDVSAYLFSPRQHMEEFRAELRANRKTRVQPSQQTRRKTNPEKKALDLWKVESFGKAIRNAIARANRARGEGETEIPDWRPHQLRHSMGTDVRRQFGLDHAQAALGHASLAATQIYAELDMGKASEVARKMG